MGTQEWPSPPGPSMTLGNTHELGERSLGLFASASGEPRLVRARH